MCLYKADADPHFLHYGLKTTEYYIHVLLSLSYGWLGVFFRFYIFKWGGVYVTLSIHMAYAQL